MTPTDILMAVFSGVIAAATVIYVVFTRKLWQVSEAQSDIQSDLRTLQLLAHKYTQNPELRVNCEWVCKPEVLIANDGPGTEETREVFETWTSMLHLWNTGSSALLITKWDLVADVGSNRPRVKKPGVVIPVDPPIIVPPHEVTRLHFDFGGRECRKLILGYDTAAVAGRTLEIPLRTRFGHQNRKEEDPDG